MSDFETPPNDFSGSHPPPAPVGGQTSTGLDPKLAGLLCYILGFVTGLLFFLVEKTNGTVRFHAAQSIVFSVTSIVIVAMLAFAGFVATSISWTLGNLVHVASMVVWLGIFILWVVLLVKGYTGERWRLPVLGEAAERLVAGEPST